MAAKQREAVPENADGEDVGRLIDAKIAALGSPRGATLKSLRQLIGQADPAIIEDVAWRKPSNPSGIFKAGLDAGTRRAVDLRDGDLIDEHAFKALIAAADAFDTARR